MAITDWFLPIQMCIRDCTSVVKSNFNTHRVTLAEAASLPLSAKAGRRFKNNVMTDTGGHYRRALAYCMRFLLPT